MAFNIERAQKLLDAVNSGAIKSGELRPDDANLLNSYLDTKVTQKKSAVPEQQGGIMGFFERLRKSNTESVAKQVEGLGGKLGVSTEDYARIPEVMRGLAKGIASMPPVSLLVPKEDRAKLGQMTTTAGKVAEGLGGFVGGIPLDVLFNPVGAAVAAKVGIKLANPLVKAAAKGAVRGATEVGLTEVLKQGVDVARGENVTPASAAKQIGGAVLGGGIFGGVLGAGFEKLGQRLAGKTTPLKAAPVSILDKPQRNSSQIYRSESISQETLDAALDMLPAGIRRSALDNVKGVSLVDDLVGKGGLFEHRTGEVFLDKANLTPDVLAHELTHAYVSKVNDPQLMAAFVKARYPVETAQEILKAGTTGRPDWGYFAQEDFTQALDVYRSAPDKLSSELRGVFDKSLGSLKNENDAANYILSRVSTDKPSKTMPTLERLYSQAIDRLQPIKRITSLLGDADLPESQNPFSLARVSRGWAGKAGSLLTAGVFDNAGAKVADSLKDVLKPVAGDLPKFRAYAVARRAVELAGRKITTGFDAADAAKSLQLLETPARQQAFEALVKFQDAVLDETMLRSGMMSEEAVKAMRDLNKQYVPFHRVFDAAEAGQKGVADTFANIGQVIKKLQGSERDIVDPLESVIKNTYALTNAAERNKVGAALAGLVEKNVDVASPWMQRVDDVTNAAKEGVVSIWRKGQRELYKVDPDLYASLTHLDKQAASTYIKILSTPASWLRAGATLTPEFIGRNPIRDQWTAFLNSKYGYTPLVDLGRGISEAVKKGDLYDEFMRSGAAQSTLVSLDRAYLQKSPGDVMGGASIWDKVRRAASNPLDALRGLSELMEEGTRLGAFKKTKGMLLAKGMSYEDALMKATQEAREITLDFGRRGSSGLARDLNMTAAFFNATIQGTDKMARAFMENPKAYTSKAVLSITLPSLYLWWQNKDDPRYKELPQWQKDLFWIVMTKDKIFRIPKPFEAGIIFGTFAERMAEHFVKKDPRAFDGLGKTLAEGFVPEMLPTALVPGISIYANKSLFTGAPIIPEREKRLPAPMQFGAYTTETAKLLGDLTKQSPRNIEELVQGYGGGLGKLGLQTGDALLNALGRGGEIPKPATDWTSLPGIRGFTVQPYQQSQSVNDFYELLNRLETQQAGMKAGGERMQQKDIGALMRLLEANKTMSEFNKQERAIQMSTRLTPEQKKQQLDALNKRQADLARKALKR